MAHKAYFVTGTDTGVGKTVVAVGLLNAARRAGRRAIGLKPVAAGGDAECDGSVCNGDALALQEAATVVLDYAAVNPVLLSRPLAPHIAAEQDGIQVEVADLAARCRAVMDNVADIVIVEGAGGWLVPLNDSETMADLVVELRLPVILVVGMRLGCLNHALLTAAAIRDAGLPLAGWVANCHDGEMDAMAENLATLRGRLPAPMLGCLPRLGGDDDAADHLDLEALLDE